MDTELRHDIGLGWVTKGHLRLRINEPGSWINEPAGWINEPFVQSNSSTENAYGS
jgi:hypothetical protein